MSGGRIKLARNEGDLSPEIFPQTGGDWPDGICCSAT